MLVLLLPFAAWASPLAPQPNTYREQARAVLETHCGACHAPRSSTANDKALKIFDLSEADFAVHMTKTQLEHMTTRIEDRSTMSKAELGAVVPKGMPVPHRPNRKEIEELKAYVSIELLMK